MSRIGKLPVPIPAGVSAKLTSGRIQVTGPRGTLAESIVDRVALDLQEDQIVVARNNDSKQSRANHGLMRALIANMVTGVTTGFTRELQIIGVGYRAEVKGPQLVMQLGYSHPIEYAIPEGIAIEVDRNHKITVTGNDKQQVGQVAANIRDFRRPDHYKGKGVRYVGEYVRIKAGKSA